MRSLRFAAAAALAAGLATIPGVVGAATPPAGSISVPDGVFYECDFHSYSYQLELPPDTISWSMDVTVRGPDGLEAGTDFVYDSPATGGAEVHLCPGLAGTYTVSALVEVTDGEYNDSTFSTEVSSFEMRLPESRLEATVNNTRPAKGETVRFTVRVADERPNGYFPTRYARVQLQVRDDSGAWVTKAAFNDRTNGQGVARINARASGAKAVVRFRTPASTDEYSGSVSPQITFRRP